MPITHDEWERGEIDPMTEDPAPEPVGEFDTEAELVLAFLSRNHDKAFTRAEIVRGVNFGDQANPETIKETLLTLPNQLMDIMGDLTASSIFVEDISDALDALVSDDTVERARIQRADGEPEIYYRLAGAER